MDGQTYLLLAVQLLAICSIAGALLLYLICKVRGGRSRAPTRGGAILITAADTALGLQLTTYLATKGYRIFAGMKDPKESIPSKLLRNWIKAREIEVANNSGLTSESSNHKAMTSVIPLHIDVSREDVLQEAVEAVNQHLPAGERGVLAVINTSGMVYRGRLENQDSAQWEAMFKLNILGYVRSARAFTQLVRPTRGRFLSIGSCFDNTTNIGDGLVAFQASRTAVEGASIALKQELQQLGIDVIILKPDGIPAENLYSAPTPNGNLINETEVTQYTASVLGPGGLRAVDKALNDIRPAEFYSLGEKNSAWQLKSAYCTTTRKLKLSNTQQRVCTV